MSEPKPAIENKKQKPGTHEQHREESLDETIAESFPASDPPSSIPDPDEDAA